MNIYKKISLFFKVYFYGKIRTAQMYSFTGSFKIVGQYIKDPYLINILQKSV